MTWVKIDDQFSDHPKLRAWGSYSPLMTALQVRALCYASRFLTNGKLPRSVVPLFTADFEAIQVQTGETEFVTLADHASEVDWASLMVKAGLWEPDREGWVIHDYLTYNLSRDEVLARREQQRAAGQRGGKTRSERARRSAQGTFAPDDTPDDSPGKRLVESYQTKTRPRSPSPSPKNKNSSSPRSSNGRENGFNCWWNEYPKKVGKAQAVREWEKLNPDEALQAVLLEAIRQQKRTVKAMVENEKRYILDPERWLKYRRWEDEAPPEAGAAVQYPKL